MNDRMNYSPEGMAGGVSAALGRQASYQDHTARVAELIKTKNGTWDGINAESVARMRLQNRFQTGLDIARYTAAIMRRDMAAYDQDPALYTQSLGAWHGFIAQQQMISVKKHFTSLDRRYIYLSGWMVAALRSEFGPLPDQSMHEKTSVPDLIREIYTFLKQADARELGGMFREIDAARAAGDRAKEAELMARVEGYQSHVVPIIADIDAGFGNAEATYLLAKKMIEAGACALQIENQVSDEKQCGHQDGKVTVPHDDFIAKVRAVRYAFLELGVEDGIIVTRTDSLGAGLTKQIAVSHKPGDIGDQYNSFLDCEEITPENARNGDVILNRNGKMLRPKRLPSNLFQFRAGTGEDRCVLDSITSLQNGADLLWIETEKPHVEQIAGMMDRVREVIPNAKLAYNNSPSFNWTLNFRQQVYDAWAAEGKNSVAEYDRAKLMSADYDATPLAAEADERIRTFQRDAAKRAGIFHHLITLPTYHTAALSTDNLSKRYFGDDGMLGFVRNVQREEIRQGIACVKHQNMAGSDVGDDHKEYFAGEAALKAGGTHNTMNQFGSPDRFFWLNRRPGVMNPGPFGFCRRGAAPLPLWRNYGHIERRIVRRVTVRHFRRQAHVRPRFAWYRWLRHHGGTAAARGAGPCGGICHTRRCLGPRAGSRVPAGGSVQIRADAGLGRRGDRCLRLSVHRGTSGPSYPAGRGGAGGGSRGVPGKAAGDRSACRPCLRRQG